MAHQEEPNQPNRRGYIPAQCVSFIEKLKRHSKQEPSEQNNNNSKNEIDLAKHTRRLSWATWIIAGVGALSFFAALLQWSALRSTDDKIGEQVAALGRQLTLLETDQRPWVHVPVFSINEPIIHDATGINITWSFTLINSGKSPAQHVGAGFVIYLGPTRFDEAIKEACDKAEQAHAVLTIFPNDPTPWGAGSLIPADDIENFRSRYGSGSAKGSFGAMTMACIAYQVLGDTKFHHTPYELIIRATNPDDTSTIPLNKQSIPIDSISVRSVPSHHIGLAD
jgi:hypothetical protein